MTPSDGSHTRDAAIGYRADIHRRMATYARPAENCAVLDSLGVVVGETEALAQERAERLNALAHPDLVLAHNSAMLGADLARHRTPEQVAAAQGTAGIAGNDLALKQRAAAEGTSYADAARRPRSVVAGTPAAIADHMQNLFEAGACDGFVVWATVSPTMWEEFGRLVVPELQRRGLVQTGYAPGTLREKLQA